ncbi:MAG: fibronectin type III domain-containing protein [Verrucomicrobia bacterium]|nr:fibronectin type III domain-containing protein [Verrucomicrobiota bacterium]
MDKANVMELMYSVNEAEVFEGENLLVGGEQPDLNNPGKLQFDLSWTAAPYYDTGVVGYTVEYKSAADDIWLTYVKGASQDFKGTPANPTLTVTNLAPGTYDFRVTAHRLAIPVERDGDGAGNPLAAKYVTLQGGGGNDGLIGDRLNRELPGGLLSDQYTLPLIGNNPIYNKPLGFIFNNEPYKGSATLLGEFATYIDGGYGNDLLAGAFINDGSGSAYTFQGVEFKGLNTLVGGQGSDTFLVRNGGVAKGDEFDWVIKYGNETPVNYGAGGIGASLNGGQHNLVISAVKFLTLSDTEVHQGKFIDQLGLATVAQFGMGNRLDNYIYDGTGVPGAGNTLVGSGGRDSIVGNSSMDVLIGGNAYGLDNVGFSIKDFASVADGGNGLTSSIFRDTDPIPVEPNGPGVADPSQFWFVPGYYGSVYDLAKNRDTLVGSASGDTGLTLDGGAGSDSMVGSSKADTFYVSNSGEHPLNGFLKGNGGGDTVIFTDSDYLWWKGHKEGAALLQNSYSLDKTDLSNLTLQMGAPTARIATGNDTANLIIGNEFDNNLDGKGVGASGIDTLVGDGLVVVNLDEKIDAAGMRGNLSSDNFIVKDYYRKSTTWAPEIVTTDLSYEDPITGQKTPEFKHEWDPSKSTYLDDDFVVIRDFEADTDFINPITGVRTSGGGNPDNLELKDNLSSYSIGNLPTSIESKNLGKIKVGPQGKDITGGEFGIYYTGNEAKWGSGEEAAPNLVAVIQSTDSLLLDRDGDGVFNAALDLDKRPSFSVSSDTTNSAVPNPLMGWGQFYELESSNFAQYINNYEGMSDSTANLSALMNQIV